ncbi:hypothetical protein ANN_21411 [Periplaneta americana]|uniref:BHLH domain-containing protein n=1 Tax=Periplaneta americana TaxID=6978 RepID=A0ABQ8SGH2_PERAM|nr:hypothetical protein ANN_21411 [Periplaneta americana]
MTTQRIAANPQIPSKFIYCEVKPGSDGACFCDRFQGGRADGYPACSLAGSNALWWLACWISRRNSNNTGNSKMYVHSSKIPYLESGTNFWSDLVEKRTKKDFSEKRRKRAHLNAIDLARDRTRNLGHRRPGLYQLANQVDGMMEETVGPREKLSGTLALSNINMIPSSSGFELKSAVISHENVRQVLTATDRWQTMLVQLDR